MSKFYIPEYVKRERSEKDAAAKVANRDLCQAVGEHVALERQKIREQREAEQRQKLEKRISERTAEGKATNDEIFMLKDEGYAYSLQLANQRMQNRIDSLTLDRDHYTKEIQKFKDQEFDSGFLVDTLEGIETELSERKLNLELSKIEQTER